VSHEKINFMDKIKKEVGYLVLIFVAFVIMFKILFYQENFMLVIRVVGSIFWISIITGFPIMYYWHQRLDFLERITIGGVLGMGLSGVISYYLSFLGVSIKILAFLVPVIIGTIGGLIVFFKNRK